ncbi:hypothetical protein N0V83_009025 [Neocucurbitaria cava]|uniref:Uncharacterized protein n=1 Tax=Neocucurbitaria cava TaxID=798079 RepID=A0A9W8Y1Y1_9PLEO|nr:hypothetical protein N0V83_009025 [Neocucurbitaria cava]
MLLKHPTIITLLLLVATLITLTNAKDHSKKTPDKHDPNCGAPFCNRGRLVPAAQVAQANEEKQKREEEDQDAARRHILEKVVPRALEG